MLRCRFLSAVNLTSSDPVTLKLERGWPRHCKDVVCLHAENEVARSSHFQKYEYSSQGQTSKSNVTNFHALPAFTVGHILTKLPRLMSSSLWNFVRTGSGGDIFWMVGGRGWERSPHWGPGGEPLVRVSEGLYLCVSPTKMLGDVSPRSPYNHRHCGQAKDTDAVKNDTRFQHSWRAGNRMTLLRYGVTCSCYAGDRRARNFHKKLVQVSCTRNLQDKNIRRARRHWTTFSFCNKLCNSQTIKAIQNHYTIALIFHIY